MIDMQEKFEVTADFIDMYHGKRLEFKLSNGDVICGRVGWMDQGDPYDLGVELRDVEENGKSLDYDVIIPESLILSFVPSETGVLTPL
jgi:translation initiation factor IF-1